METSKICLIKIPLQPWTCKVDNLSWHLEFGGSLQSAWNPNRARALYTFGVLRFPLNKKCTLFRGQGTQQLGGISKFPEAGMYNGIPIEILVPT